MNVPLTPFHPRYPSPHTSPHLSAPTWYTGPTCDLKLAMKVPLTPSHSFTDLSNDADRIHRPSGENWT